MESQQALVDSLFRQGVDAARSRRLLAEFKLAADLLQDRVAHLEDTVARGSGFKVKAKRQAGQRRHERDLALG